MRGIEKAKQFASGGYYPYDTNTGDADQAIDALAYRFWNTNELTFSFPATRSDYESNYYDTNAANSVGELNNTQKNAARDALDQYAAISNLTFTELTGSQTGDSDLRLAESSAPSTAYAYYPSSNPVGGDVFFNQTSYDTPVIGNYAYATMLHELGHAMGLKHGHEANGPGAVPLELDSMEFTVMTYRSWVGKPLNYGYANETWGFAQSLMMLDIAAIQRMYGADFNTNSDDTVYTFSTLSGEIFVNGVGAGTPGGNRVFLTIWDGDGEDTYDFSNYSTDLLIDLMPGSYVDLDSGGNFQRAMLDFGYNGNPVTYARGHVFNALQYDGDDRSLIENAKGGSGDDIFWGNDGKNFLQGGSGDDVFYDSAGSDTYIGDGGTDTLIVSGNYEGYLFTLGGGGFIEMVAGETDLINNSIEWITFSDQTRAFEDLVATTLPTPPPDHFYFSLISTDSTNALNLSGGYARDEDIIAFDGESFRWIFDGSDVGVTGDIDAIAVLSNDQILFSLSGSARLTGVGNVDDSDIIVFTASQWGSQTAGTFSMYFDGSDVGLTTSGEDIDALDISSDGSLLISTRGSFSVSGASGNDEDILKFIPVSAGSNTQGLFSMYFDGSDVGLSGSSSEDVDGLAVTDQGALLLSSVGNASVSGANAADEDAFLFAPSSLGSNTQGEFDPKLYFDGSMYGLGGNDVYAFDFVSGNDPDFVI